KLSSFSEKALDAVRTKDMGQVGEMITNLIVELKNFDVEEKEKGFKALFRKASNKLVAMKSKYAKVETNVNVITTELERHETTLLKDVAMLDQMYAANLAYFKELTMYILAGKKKLEETRNTELVALQNKAKESGLAEDVQAAKDLAGMCDRFEKKIYDLELTRTIALQSGPQIRMVQSSDTIMAEKIQSTIVNTIPLWKNQMVIAIGVEHSNQAARAQREVSDMTNELLKKNADALKVATIEAVKESERGIIDIETIKHTNEQLISTMDEVLRIQSEGKEKRRNAEMELSQIEHELKMKLLEASKA
nr:toxic anion resistance protein [Treponemataceae bacterium]